MRKLSFIVLPVFLVLLGAESWPEAPAAAGRIPESGTFIGVDTFDQSAALAALREQIKGREEEASEEVFQNMQLLKKMPAGRLLRVMEMGFSRSLGVSCTHCHNPEAWESEEKQAKQTARDMWVMVGKINGELLPAIPNLSGGNPMVNCTTCHRGQAKPALNME